MLRLRDYLQTIKLPGRHSCSRLRGALLGDSVLNLYRFGTFLWSRGHNQSHQVTASSLFLFLPKRRYFVKLFLFFPYSFAKIDFLIRLDTLMFCSLAVFCGIDNYRRFIWTWCLLNWVFLIGNSCQSSTNRGFLCLNLVSYYGLNLARLCVCTAS